VEDTTNAKSSVAEAFPNNSSNNNDDNESSVNISNDATFNIGNDINNNIHTAANSAEETGDDFSKHIDNLAAELKAEMKFEYGLLQEIIQGEGSPFVHGSDNDADEDKGNDASPSKDNSPPKTERDDEHWSSRMEALELELSASRERASQLAQQLQQKELQWIQETQHADQQLQAQQDLVRQQYNLQVQELQEQHETELELLQNRQEALLVESTRAAARVMDQSRQHTAAMKEQLEQERRNYGTQLEHAVQQATQTATDTTMKSAMALLQEQADAAAASKVQAIEVEAIQATCNALEAELGDALCQMEQLQTERNDTVSNLQVQIIDLQSRLCTADQELQRLQSQSEAQVLQQENLVTAQSRIVASERERDDALERASRFDALVTMIEEETQLEREQYIADIGIERSASTVLRNELEKLREAATGQVAAIADDRERRIQLLAVVQSYWAHAQAETKEQLNQGRRDSDVALQELQLRVMSNAAGKDEDEDEYTAEMVAIFRAIRRHNECQQELALENLNAEHCNEMKLLNEARLADMVDLFHVCQNVKQIDPSTSREGSTHASPTSLNQVMAKPEPPALVAPGIKPLPEPSVASNETVGDAFVALVGETILLAEPKKEDVPSCVESARAIAAVKEFDGGETEHVPIALPQISVQVGYVPVEQKSDLQSPTSAFAPYRRTQWETEAQTENPAVDDSSVAPLLEPSSKHQESSVEAEAVQPTVEATTKKYIEQAGTKLQEPKVEPSQTVTPAGDDMPKSVLLQPDPKHQKRPTKRESALRRPTSLAAPVSRSNLRTPLRTKSSIPSKEVTDSNASKSSATRDRVKRKAALPNFSSSASKNESQQVRVSAIGKHSERASASASALKPSHVKRNEPNNTLTGLPSRKTATNRVESQIGGKKTPTVPPTSRPSGLQGGTKSSIRKNPPVSVNPAPSRTSSATGTIPSRAGKVAGRATASGSSTSRIGVAATSRIGKPTEKTRSLLPKYGGVKRTAGGIVAPSSNSVRSTAKASGLKTPLNPTRHSRVSTSTPSSSAQPKPVIESRSSARSTKPVTESSSFPGSTSASVGSKASTKSPSASRSKADPADEGIVSPKELIQNVLKTLSPSPKSKPTPKAVPDESIDETPREASSHQVTKKFQSLFTDWSTAKKSPRPRNNSTQDMDELPSSLFADWSTKKRQERPKSNEVLSLCKRQKQAVDTRNLGETIGPISLGATSPAASNPSLVSPVAVKPDSYFLGSSFSPEELLVSPTPVTRQGRLSHHRDATRIQTCFRAQCARKSYRHQRGAIIKLQCFARGSFAQREVRAAKATKRAVKAALDIQAFWRGSMVRKARNAKTFAVSVIQTYARRMLQSKSLKTEDVRNRAAQCLQTRWRAKTSKENYDRTRKTVTMIQSEFRRVQARASYVTTKMSCLTIQKFFRECLSQRRVTRRRRAALTIQRSVRGLSSRRGLVLFQRAALTVQRSVRMSLTRRKFMRVQHAALIIQRSVRGSLAQRKFMLVQRAALTIQRNVRGFLSWRGLELGTSLVRTNSMRVQRAALTIQRNVRGSLARQYFMRVQRAALTIQRNVRGFTSRRGSKLFQRAALTIQRNFRGFSSRRGSELFHRAALIIQRSVRASFVRRHFVRVQRSALTIQRNVRVSLARRNFVRVQHAALTIQRSVRGSFARRHFMLVQNAALTIQRYSRGALSRDKYATVLMSVLALQRVARGYRARSHARRLVANENFAICIQKQWRGSIVRVSNMVLQTSSIRIQALVRGSNVRAEAKMADDWFKAAVCLQRYWRGSLIRSDFVLLRNSAILMQAIARGSSTRLKARKLLLEASAARSIQTKWLGSRTRKEYNATRESAILIQSIMRRAGARAHYNTILASSFDKSAIESVSRGKVTSTKKQAKKPDGDRSPLKPRIAAESVIPVRQETAKPKRKPFGDIKGSAPVPSTRKSSRKVVTDTYDEENVSSTRKSSRKVVTDTYNEENTNNAKVENETETRCAIEKLKVVELKAELTGYGIENKALRNVRKAELVDMCLNMRTQPQSA
jgi:hypothetical protein